MKQEELNHLAKKLFDLLPSDPPQMSTLLNSSVPFVRRFNQMRVVYGDVAIDALADAGFVKYGKDIL